MKGFGQELGPDAIASLLQRPAKPVFLLGAGASLRSGIPLTDTLVDAIARFSYCKAHNRNPQDPTLTPSDWIRWLEKQPWHRPDQPKSSLYPLAVEHLLQPQSNRREFFARILKPDVPPSDGYRRLALLLARHSIQTILTTNFDDLVARTARATSAIAHIDEFVPGSNLDPFSINPAFPQVVYLHGSVHQYTDKNNLGQIETLDDALPPLLQPLLRDHALVVVGYRGTEPSVMRHLLISQAQRCGNYREGIYWCHLPGSNPLESALVAELAATINTNLQFVEISGFDELMRVLERSSPSAGEIWHVQGTNRIEPADTVVHDLRPSGTQLADLSESLLKSKLLDYAQGMRLPPPDLSSPEQLKQVLLARNLAVRVGDVVQPTHGGQLLFARAADMQLPQARVQVTVSGPASWVAEILDQGKEDLQGDSTETIEIVGDLWTQHDTASSLLSRVNRPFRMKGAVSQTTYPYPPLALKELLTNLLAHRDYAAQASASILIERDRITFRNPGGLVDLVQRQLEDESIQEALGGAGQPVKGYRNPVVSDFFFFAGAMDKEGSGLPDVLREAANNLNSVEFGPSKDNSNFEATLRCRPEALEIDAKTLTARPQQAELRYSPNLLQVVSWPQSIRKLGTIATPKQLGETQAAGAPPFGAAGEWLWTFLAADEALHPALDRICLSEESHEVPIQDLLSHPQAWAMVPRLLNAALGRYLQALGMTLKFEAGRVRAYYASDEGKPREISYKSAFKQAKRTVAKPIVSRTTGKLIYWEHKAVSLRFEPFGNTWALSMLPGYVFTADGVAMPIASDRIGPLTTRRAARDYNPTVLHDLVFWARMIARGAETDFLVPLSAAPDGPQLLVAAMVPTFVFQDVVQAGVSIASESSATLTEELEALQDEIEQAITEGEENEAADQ